MRQPLRQLIQHDERIPYLDGWRGVAVLAVLFGHFVSDRWLNGGRFGVEMFFVLSGRLMAGFLFVTAVPLKDFMVRRMSRIYPAFVVAIIVLFAVSRLPNVRPASFAQATASVATLYNYLLPALGRVTVYDHIWSLCIEIHTYALLFAATWLIRLRGLRPMPILMMLAITEVVIGIGLTASGNDYRAVYWLSHVRGASILIGAIAYLYLHKRPALLDWLPSCTPLIFGFLGLFLSLNLVPDPIKYTLGTTAIAFSLCTLPAAYRWMLRALSFRPLILIGLWSYSIYLWQQGFYAAAHGRTFAPSLIPAIILTGYLSFSFIETPARKAINRWLHVRRGRSAAAVQP